MAAIDMFEKVIDKKTMDLIDRISTLILYFEDADKEEMPVMLKGVKWKDVKNFFIEEVKKVKYESD